MARAAPISARMATWQRARELVFRYGWNSITYQILNPGITHWFSTDGDAVVGYVVAGRCRVVAGSPTSAGEQLLSVSLAFEDDARQHGQRVCYFGAQDRLADALSDHGPRASLQLGAQPFWHPGDWPAIIAGKASLRAQLARARNKRTNVTRWAPEQAQQHPALRACLDAWLDKRGLPPLHFLVETETLAHLADRRVYVAERAGQVVGFLIATPVPLRNGWLIEQIVRGTGAANGTNELLLDAAMRDLAALGADYVTLGLSPLSRHGPDDEDQQRLTIRLLLQLMRIHARRFYNFDGLDRFKAKFQPLGWEPVYALSAERRTSLRTLYGIAGAFAGASPLVFLPYAMLRAAAQEGRWAAERLGKRKTAQSGKQ